MKKWISVLIVLVVIALSGCAGSSNLPKGHAESVWIDWGSGITLENVDFEFVTETTVKITEEDGTVTLYPLDKIDRITVSKE